MELLTKIPVIIPEGVFIIGTYDENGIPNAMNAAWGIQSDYHQIAFFLAHHKTTENIEKTGAFTVAMGTRDTLVISDYFGLETGKKINKIEKAGCHVHKSSHVNAPIIEEYPLTLECECVEWNEATGLLLGKIVGQEADESILTDGKVDLDKMQPLILDTASGKYRVIGPAVGQAFHDGLALK